MYLEAARFTYAIEAGVMEVVPAAAHLALQDVLPHNTCLLAYRASSNAKATVWAVPANEQQSNVLCWTSVVTAAVKPF